MAGSTVLFSDDRQFVHRPVFHCAHRPFYQSGMAGTVSRNLDCNFDSTDFIAAALALGAATLRRRTP